MKARRQTCIAGAALLATALASCTTSQTNVPVCTRVENNLLVLEAQAVPSATRIPCITSFAPGWTFGGSLVEKGRARMWLDSDRAGLHALQVDLTRTCDTTGAVEVPPGPLDSGLRVLQKPTSLPPDFAGQRYLLFHGGCITYTYRFRPGTSSTLVLEADATLGTVRRAGLVRAVGRVIDLTLCGASAPPCVG